jgi:hypothetical protein
MSISQEWTKVIRDVRGIFLAIRASIGLTWGNGTGRRAKPRAVRTSSLRNNLIDRRVLAELERRKNFALLNNTRSMVR